MMSRKSDARNKGFKKEALIHLDSLLRTALFMTGDETTANDLIQKTYQNAYRLCGTLNETSDYRTWLYKIMAGLLDKYQLDQGPYPEAADISSLGLGEIDENQLDPNSSENIVDNLCHQVGEDAIQNAISELPTDLRLITVLSFLEGFSYPEIAGITDIDIGTVKLKLTGGRQLLKEIIWNKMIDDGLLKKYPAYC